jgi:uncharacterized protein
MPYLIDGHNLIPKLGLRLDAPDDEMELVALLQEFSRLTRHRVEVYFDGAPTSQARTQKFGLVTAHFIRLATTADLAIRASLQKIGREARNWTVVSSDHEVMDSAREVHANVVSSDQFASQLKKLPKSTPALKRERGLSSEEVEDWLKFFKKNE